MQTLVEDTLERAEDAAKDTFSWLDDIVSSPVTAPVVMFLYRRDTEEGQIEYWRMLYRLNEDSDLLISASKYPLVEDPAELFGWYSSPRPSPKSWRPAKRAEPAETIGEFVRVDGPHNWFVRY